MHAFAILLWGKCHNRVHERVSGKVGGGCAVGDVAFVGYVSAVGRGDGRMGV